MASGLANGLSGMNAAELALLIESRLLPSRTEERLQEAISDLLTLSSVEFIREARLSDQDRPDFLVGDVAIEVKISGGVSEVTRQLHRYAQHDCVKEILLVTSRMQLARVPSELSGKPVRVAVQLGGL